ncbi:MAG: hypothetical protein AAF787_13530 [Chloroflexota bacterium]
MTVSSFQRKYLRPQQLLAYALIAAALIGASVALSGFYGSDADPGIDWKFTYNRAAENWRNPYNIEGVADREPFTNPPWVLLLLPHAFLFPEHIGAAVNAVITVVVILLVIRRYNGGWQTALMTFTSLPFFDLMLKSNVDWIPMLALLVPPMWGLPLLAIKPHSIGAVALVWWKERNFSPWMLVPAIVIGLLSFIPYGFWVQNAGLPWNAAAWNFAPFPYFIPIGLYMLYRAYRSEDAFLAAAATPLLTPYIATYSVTAVFAFVGSKYKREMFIVWCAYWVYFIIQGRVTGFL